jgi:hypothetical protein
MKRLSIAIGFIFLISNIITVSLYQPINAADARLFDAGKIIDDGVFTNSDSMSPQEIQQFLNNKMTTCDTYGQKQSELGGGTRAQWAAARGYSTTFTCLKDYYENPNNGANNYGGQAIPNGAISAAQIIYNYSKQFNINPQVIIVTLQKEKGMVTDEWPILKDMREAMGFGCPDNVTPGTPACDPAYGSFSTQVYQAARHFRGYMDKQYCNYSAGWCTTYLKGQNYIAWSPNGSCGGSTVNIENLATSALYSYTPYRPNQAALNAGYGTGDSCSAYGNRNFYLYFTDWFGSTIKPPIGNCPETNTTCVWSFRNDLNGKYFYTTNISERNTVNGSHYTYTGVHFYVRNSATSGTKPVYRLYNAQGYHFWTTSTVERDLLLNDSSWSSEGVGFYVDPVDSNTGDPVRRLYTQNNGGNHILTRDETYIEQLLKNGYVDEGIVFTSVSTTNQEIPPATGYNNVYRFNLKSEHFWTNSARERDTLIRSGATYEGVTWQTAVNAQNPVFRLYSPKGRHFWTTSTSERDNLIQIGWRYEGTAWQASSTGENTYRLYDFKTGRHLFTPSENEKNILLNSGSWRDEGVSWHQ